MPTDPTRTASRPSAGDLTTLGYGLVVYALFLLAFGWAVAFVANADITVRGVHLLPTLLDGEATAPRGRAIAVDVLLLGLFAMQHSVMARQGFKRWWTRVVPAAIERSTYVLLATVCLALIMLLWQPIEAVVWRASAGWLRVLLVGIGVAGWLLVLLSTFLIDHWDLFGVRQTLAAARRRSVEGCAFVTPRWYRLVRHPLYLGFLIAFWAAPTMTVGHLLFALATTAYILIGIRLEERDLVASFGDDYREYRRRVPMLVPRPFGRRIV